MRRLVSVILVAAAISFALVATPAQAGYGGGLAAGLLVGLAAGLAVTTPRVSSRVRSLVSIAQILALVYWHPRDNAL